MKSFFFSVAGQEDDKALRNLIRVTPMEGEISVAFEREPDYFYTLATEGKFNQAIVAKDAGTKSVVATGSRSIKPAFINGKVNSLGYLSTLRVHKDYRNTTLLSRGYHYLRELHNDRRVKAYISTIIADNAKALNLLMANRDGLPKYHDIGAYYTFAIKLVHKNRKIANAVTVKHGSEFNLDLILDCIHRNGKEKQFYPYYENKDFTSKSEYLRDFKIDDFYVATIKDKVVGVLAKWDQNAFKQTVICGYSKKIKRLMPLYNLFANFCNLSALPLLGSKLNSFYISFIAIDKNNPSIFRALLDAIYNEHIGGKYSHMITGLYEKDPLVDSVMRYPHLKYKSRVFIVCWQDGQEWFRSLDNRLPYLEVATL